MFPDLMLSYLIQTQTQIRESGTNLFRLKKNKVQGSVCKNGFKANQYLNLFYLQMSPAEALCCSSPVIRAATWPRCFLLSLAGDRGRLRGEEGGGQFPSMSQRLDWKCGGEDWRGAQGSRDYSDLSGTAQGNAIPNTAECYKPPP